GEALMMIGELRPAIAMAQRAVTLKPDFARAHANLAYFKAQACEWRNFDRVAAQVLALLRQEAPDIPPFVVLMLPATPADRLRAARQSSEGFARGVTRMSHAPSTAPRPVRQSRPAIRPRPRKSRRGYAEEQDSERAVDTARRQ